MGVEPAAADWVPSASTLPTAEQPLRTAEFDHMFRTALRAVAAVEAENRRRAQRLDDWMEDQREALADQVEALAEKVKS